MNAVWRWPLKYQSGVTLTFDKEPTYESLTHLREILDVALEGYAPPRVASSHVAGVRVIQLLDPR